MSLFSVVKNIFGFGPDVEFDVETSDDVETDTPALPTAEEPSATDDTPQVEGLVEVPTLPEIDPEMKRKIFEGVVAMFNESLPGFLANSVDPAKQEQLLVDALDKGLVDYLNGLMLSAEQYAEAKLKGATETARRESERLRSDMQQIEQQRTTLREQQLSADRRRRALADRVTDLEAQLASAEAEREQFELERRSLLNKLKVSDVQPGVVEELRQEVDTLRAQLAAAAQENPAEAPEPVVQTVIQGVPEEEHQAALEREQEAGKKIEELEKLLADIRNQQELSQGMYSDLQNQYATEREARQQAEASLEEAHKIVDSVNEIQQQMNQVESMIQKRDERIARLKANNKKLKEQLEEALNACRAGADNGLFGLPQQAERAAAAAVPSDSLASLEDDFEVPDWFVSEPQPGEVSPLLTSDAEFGYQEPPRKPRKPENDAQLSLF
ncbi:MAG: hypothetical protein HDS65_01510 [Bacteroidales bacterium]|nr:hypothetical protein [Bacteroidales bacterium]